MARNGRRATHEERVRAVQLMESGWRAEAVAEALGVSRGSVFAWRKAFREGGLEALSTKFAGGRPTMLSDEQMLRVYTWIVGSDPRAHTFGFALWTRQIVRDLIARELRVRLSLPTVGRVLRKLSLAARDDFLASGMDSLTAIELRRNLQRSLRAELKATTLFVRRTAESLAEHFLDELRLLDSMRQ